MRYSGGRKHTGGGVQPHHLHPGAARPAHGPQGPPRRIAVALCITICALTMSLLFLYQQLGLRQASRDDPSYQQRQEQLDRLLKTVDNHRMEYAPHGAAGAVSVPALNDSSLSPSSSSSSSTSGTLPGPGMILTHHSSGSGVASLVESGHRSEAAQLAQHEPSPTASSITASSYPKIES